MISQFFFLKKYSRGFKNAECNLVDFKVVDMVFKNASKNVSAHLKLSIFCIFLQGFLPETFCGLFEHHINDLELTKTI